MTMLGMSYGQQEDWTVVFVPLINCILIKRLPSWPILATLVFNGTKC